ncbi:TPA_asm: L [Phellodendron betacytorhabdovirus 1]|nr:TPA_asm: L [Phellodendron betacytorhabdovirus 1]
MDIDFLFSQISDSGYDDESFLSGFLDSRQKNLSGLGDFHLRSAIKAVNIEKLKRGGARFRENQDYKNFCSCFKPDNVVNGDAAHLLSYFLIFGNELVSSDFYAEFRGIKVREFGMGKKVVQRRILMEMNRDFNRNILNDPRKEGDGNIRKKLMLEFEDISPSYYYYVRSVTEMLIQLSSGISTKRSIHSDSKLVSEVYTDRLGSPVLVASLFANVLMVVGGDLMFINVGEYKMSRDISEFSELKNMMDHIGLRDEIIEGKDFFNGSNKKTWYCYSADVLRMINDKMSERDIVLRTAKISSICLRPIYPDVGLLTEVFLSGDLLLYKYNNEAYKAIKCFEAIMTGGLLSKCQSIIVDKHEFLNTTCDDLIEEYPQFAQLVNYWKMKALSISNDNHLSQLYGLYRLWGHPEVKSSDGLKKVMRLGKAEKQIIPELAEMAGFSFLEEVFSRYKIKWGRYPSFEVIVGEDSTLDFEAQNSYLIECLINNEKLDYSKDIYVKSDWNKIEVKKTFDIPDTFNLTMVVDDKAISPPKSFLIDVGLNKKKYMDPFERRGVLKWMNEDFLECRSFLHKIDIEGLEDDHCVIGLYPKERELNSVPRMFSLMSAKMRNYVVVSEHMIADDILPFFPQVTMTDDLLSLTKKIYSTTQSQRTNKVREDSYGRMPYYKVSVCLNMDFEKWNLNMRMDSTYNVFLQMGKLYGMPNLFNRTYEIFEKSFIYLSDENANIKVEKNTHGKYQLKVDNETSYTGHKGGFEGLRQKGWTVFTVAVIKMILEKFPVTYKLMGQGDNQVLLLTLRTGHIDYDGKPTALGYHELSDVLKNVISSLERIFLGLGLPLKTLESWRSEEFFLYGKFPVKKGVPLSMSLKRLSRSFPFSNEDSMTIDNVMGATFTNAQAASMSDVTHLVAYYSGIFETFNGVYSLLKWHPFIGKGLIDILNETVEWFTFENITKGDSSKSKRVSFEITEALGYEELAEIICMYPKSLGGSNGITEYEFLMRGFPDNQTRDMTYLTEMISSNMKSENTEIVKMVSLMMNITKLMFSKSLNLDFLVEDPCSINILQPQTPMTVLRKKVKRVLSDNVTFKNENFMELFKLSNDKSKRELLGALASEEVLFPRLLHDCYAASLFGFVDGIVSKVDKTVTVQRMCLELSQEDIILGICRIEANFLRYLLWRSMFRRISVDGEPKFSCPTNYIRWARDYGWKKKVEGVTVPYPSHILRMNGVEDAADCDRHDFISAHISDYTPNGLEELVSNLGRAPPYLGSYTKEKIKNHDRVALYSSEPLLRRIIKLMRVVSWGNLDNSNLSDYLVRLMDSVCDVDHDIFMINKEDVGGSIEHRYKDSALKHGALSCVMYGLGTWMHLSTDSFDKYSKGGKNYTLHFQAILCWAQSLMYEILINRCDWKDFPMKEFHFHLDCEDCIKGVDYEIPDIGKVESTLIPSLRSNPYCYAKNVSLTEKDRSVFSCKNLFNIGKHIDINKVSKKDIKMMYHELWAYEIFKDIIGDATEDDPSVGVGILELSKYPRISFLRMDIQLLLQNMFLMLVIWQYRIEADRDKYQETALSFKKIKKLTEIAVSQCGPSGFLGLSLLFTWPEKVKEISDLYEVRIPDSCCLSRIECMQAGKSLLLSFIKNQDDIGCPAKTKYLNLSHQVSLDMSLMMKYISYHDWENINVCLSCKRSVLENIRGDKVYELTGMETCEKGHFWFDKEKLTKNIIVTCFPEDALSKNLETQSILSVVPKKVRFAWGDKMKWVQIMKNSFSLKALISRKDIRFSTSESFVEKLFIFHRERNYMRMVSRCATSDISSGYRLLDIIIGLNIPYSEVSKKILSLGDGSGTSGLLISKMLNCKVMTSTMVDCTEAFPQTFPHSIPTSQIYGDLEDFDNSISKEAINNVFNPKFIELLSGKLTKDNITLAFCDIELEHNETKLFLDGKSFPYSKLVAVLSNLKLKHIVIKVRILDNGSLYHIIETICGHYNDFKMFFTPYCNNMKGDLFFLLSDPKERKEKIVYSDRMLSSRCRRELSDKVSDCFSLMTIRDVPKEYYLAANQIIMMDNVLRNSMNDLRSWFSNKRLGFDDKMRSFTKFYHSIAAARNPIEVAHHTDNKLKYEYESSVRDVGLRMLAIGLSLIRDEEIIGYFLDNLEDFWIYRPVKLKKYHDVSVIERYSYEIINVKICKELYDDNMIEYDYLYLKPIQIRKDSSILRFVPLMHMIAESEEMLQYVNTMDRISFEYTRQKTLHAKERKEAEMRKIVLSISKSSDYNKLRF